MNNFKNSEPRFEFEFITISALCTTSSASLNSSQYGIIVTETVDGDGVSAKYLFTIIVTTG